MQNNDYVYLGEKVRSTFKKQQYTKNTDYDFQFIFERIKNREINEFLDLGCGIGRFTKKFAEKNIKKITAIDISKDMIEEAKLINNHQNINYIVMDGEKFDFSNKYDVILSIYTGVFGLLPTKKRNITLLNRITSSIKGNGSIILMFRNLDYYKNKGKLNKDDQVKSVIFIEGEYLSFSITTFDMIEIKKILESKKFESINFFSANSGDFGANQINYSTKEIIVIAHRGKYES